MTVLVLLDRPEYLNIPYFEMPDPSSRENRFTRLNLNSLAKMVGRRVLHGFLSTGTKSSHQHPKLSPPKNCRLYSLVGLPRSDLG